MPSWCAPALFHERVGPLSRTRDARLHRCQIRDSCAFFHSVDGAVSLLEGARRFETPSPQDQPLKWFSPGFPPQIRVESTGVTAGAGGEPGPATS
eukprot:9490058-Pyramimonas_sp.AAC.1